MSHVHRSASLASKPSYPQSKTPTNNFRYQVPGAPSRTVTTADQSSTGSMVITSSDSKSHLSNNPHLSSFKPEQHSSIDKSGRLYSQTDAALCCNSPPLFRVHQSLNPDLTNSSAQLERHMIRQNGISHRTFTGVASEKCAHFDTQLSSASIQSVMNLPSVREGPCDSSKSASGSSSPLSDQSPSRTSLVRSSVDDQSDAGSTEAAGKEAPKQVRHTCLLLS